MTPRPQLNISLPQNDLDQIKHDARAADRQVSQYVREKVLGRRGSGAWFEDEEAEILQTRVAQLEQRMERLERMADEPF